MHTNAIIKRYIYATGLWESMQPRLGFEQVGVRIVLKSRLGFEKVGVRIELKSNKNLHCTTGKDSYLQENCPQLCMICFKFTCVSENMQQLLFST